MLKIAITGHRNLLDESFVEKEIERIISKTLTESNINEFEAYTGLAYGADTIFARVTRNKFKGILKVALPFNAKEYLKDFDTDERRNEFNEMLKTVVPVVIEKELPTEMDKDWRNNAYYNCGKYLVDQCDVLIAVWDGFEAEGLGGTGDIVNYAHEKNKEVIIIPVMKIDTNYEGRITALYKEKDREAGKLKANYTWKWQVGIILGVLGAICLAISVSFELSNLFLLVCAIIETVFFSLALIMAKQVNSKTGKLKMITLRLEAELLRVIEKCVKAGISLERLKKTILTEDRKEAKIRLDRNIENFENLFANPVKEKAVNIEETKGEIAGLLTEQLNYHKGPKRIEKYAIYYKRAEEIINYIKIVFIIGMALHLVSAILTWINYEDEILNHWIHVFGLFFSLASPAVYAGVEAWKYFEEWERFYGESLVMIGFFEEQEKKLASIDDMSSMKAFAHNLRAGMWQENLTWQYTINFKVFQGIA